MGASVATEPEVIRCALEGYADRLRRVGHETGALSPWLHRGLERLRLKMVLLETRHVHAAPKAQRNKTDKNDALGVAQLVRSGWYRDVHVKSEASYRLRLGSCSRTGGLSSANSSIWRTRSGTASRCSG